MEFRHLECFLAVVDHGGMVRAAAALHMAQPSLTQSIQALERELGAELFHRIGRGATLTPAGAAMVKPARQVLREEADARASVAESAGRMVGQVEIAALSGAFKHPLTDLVGVFRTRYPHVTLRIREAGSESELVDLIGEGRVELGFGFLPAAGSAAAEHCDTAGLTVTVLGHEELYLALPAGLDDQVSDPVALDRLPDLPVITVDRDAVLHRVVVSALRASGASIDVGVVTHHRHVQLPLVAAGAGMAWVPHLGKFGIGGDGVVLRSTDPRLVLSHGVLRGPGELAPPAREFLELALATADPA